MPEHVAPPPADAPRQTDYFDRLLARHTPHGGGGVGAGGAGAGGAGAGGAGGAGAGVARARPRLPGPFERAQAQWSEAVEPDAPAPLVPPVSYPAHETGGQPGAWQIRVERRTEIRTGPPAPEAAVRDAAHAPTTPPWNPRPAPPERPALWSRPGRVAGPRVTPDAPGNVDGVRPARPVAAEERGAARADPATAARAVPRIGRGAAARRTTTQPPVARRRTPAAEPTVHVRIGRLEVRATGADRAPTRAARAGRSAPAMSLSDYLSAGRGVNE